MLRGMTFAPFKTELLSRVSHDALNLCFWSRPNPACHETTYDKHALGLLGRIRLWLRLLWGRGQLKAAYPYTHRRPLNRADARIKKRSLPVARQGNPIAVMLSRVIGRARYLRFIYDECLTGRARWCFSDWNWKWAKRICFKENPLTRRKKRAALARSFKLPIDPKPD